MTRKALLIGSQNDGLTGVRNDVEAMAAALEPRGFQVTRLVTPDATRAAVLDAYEKLIVDARPDDAYVLYYSGHGGRAQAEDGPDQPFIVPDDFDDTGEFRGITGVELSVLLARLTDVALNTTVVLDCCHAAHMSRQSEMRVKALLRSPTVKLGYDKVRRHNAEVLAGLKHDPRSLISNPHAVRVVACSPSESAWETANRDGVEMGLLTDALTRALRDHQGLRVSWATLLDAVRRDVQEMQPVQRPEAEGPSARAPFETTDLDPLSSLPVVAVTPEQIQLLGAPLLGVEPHDEFTIMPGGATGPQDGPALGTATVTSVQPTSATARLRAAGPGRDLPADARAHRTRAAASALPVRLPLGHPAAAELTKAINLRPLLRPDPEAVVAVVADEQGRLVVHDDADPLHQPYPATSLGIGSIMANLQRIAQATAIRRLTGDPQKPLTHDVQVEWGRVRDGREEPLERSGALLFAYGEERIYIRLRNNGDRAMFVSLLDVGIASRIEPLTAADPGGIRLAAGATYTYGWDEDRRRLTGVTVTWPEGISTAVARPETVLALISDGPVDVGVLRQQGVRSATAPESPLERLLGQIATGATREIGDAPASRVRYAVVPIDFVVSPTPPPQAETAPFLVDDRPEQPVRLLSARGANPGRVAVRIGELIVHRNRALGSADIRVDAMVLTNGAGGVPAYHAETMRFSNVHDDERLPLDNALIYHGPAVDFLDIAVWVSRDTTGSQALGALLEQRLTSPEVQAAGLAIPSPHAAVAVAVAGAAAVLVNTAYELLLGVVGRSVGLYRTSLLAQEQFGLGRHQRHPQDFSFTFSIEGVDA
ncbi:caspase family protein [Paractinoplanes lichenicola]|uniref:Caspase family protein n=1 Tax=Paractinoplanes lichenicola TaxID=2802976 RepID=A0ABS1VUB0_9ACTN|nr:caspase family protein [Actinoplanes lichenicola]MBL7258048.1 caspase family protein [Actinoplanes lichenicola]